MKEKNNYNYGVLLNSDGRVINVSNPDITGAVGWKYDAATSTITIFEPFDYTLTGSTSSNKVIVQPDSSTKGPFNIILQDVEIDKSTEPNSSAISIKEGILCRLLVYGYSNSFKSGENAAAINISEDSSLEIDELIPEKRGYIDVYGGNYASCIGANAGESYGNITIKNVEIHLNISSDGSGIGYGDIEREIQGISGKIEILGGRFYSWPFNVENSERHFNGICCNTLEISSGYFEFDYRDYDYNLCGSGIAFAGRDCDKSEIIINGDAEIIIYGGMYCPGIDCYVKNGEGKLIINGGNITAYGGEDAAGIGIGGNCSNTNQSIIINNGSVTAYGGENAAGIGSGSWTDFGTIEINGGLISAYGNSGAGIGGGKGSNIESIKISSCASVIAESNDDFIYDIGDGYSYSGGYSSNYSGLYSGIYRGEISGIYQGRLSGLFKGEIFRDYTKRINSNVSGFYTGKAKGIYSGMFLGKFTGYTKSFD